MTCGVHGIYLKFGSFNGINPIVPYYYYKGQNMVSIQVQCWQMTNYLVLNSELRPDTETPTPTHTQKTLNAFVI
jgi:hypothetical protein